MKAWLGVIGRACIEFAIILLFVSFAAGAAMFVAVPTGGMSVIYKSAIGSALGLVPLAALLALFLAFFPFELRIKSRTLGWIGLLALGALLLSFGIGVRRVPLFRELVANSGGATEKSLRLIPPGMAVQQGPLALWIGSFDGEAAVDAVAVDFSSDYPRLAYSSRASLDFSTGDADIQGRSYRAALPSQRPIALVPEASFFSGSWIWDRLATMDDEPLYLVFAAAGGFLLLAIGFRFLCRITGWPLANALLATAGLVGLVVLDAALSSGAVLGTIESFLRRLGFPLKGPLLLAGIEGFVGLALGIADLAAAPKPKRRLDE